ncbi:unnamed protein product [Effrenium voratum]|uniref:Uncharacterized protein n=1 Tax=Effrenium voratum TaxID=2562239 RepID=A0AA36MVU7_9DINO|nr:unnamed protein product [Effrenium voratum]CAJ1440485.1 unnamed protein product [Effrenium voratum]
MRQQCGGTQSGGGLSESGKSGWRGGADGGTAKARRGRRGRPEGRICCFAAALPRVWNCQESAPGDGDRSTEVPASPEREAERPASQMSGVSVIDDTADDLGQDPSHQAMLHELEGIMSSMEAELLDPSRKHNESPARCELDKDDEELLVELLEDLKDPL